MYINYFSVNQPISRLIKSVKDEGLITIGSEMNFIDPIYGESFIKCEYVETKNGVITLFKNEKGKLISYPLKGKFFVGKHFRGFYESFAIFGSDKESKKIVLNDDFSSLIPKLKDLPKTADEILELLICDPRYLNYISVQDLKPILAIDPDFLKHIKTIVRDSTERILSNKIENLTDTESKSLNKLKNRYKKEIEFYYHELAREIKHSNLDVGV